MMMLSPIKKKFIRQKIYNIIIRNTSLQYPLFLFLGVIKQLKSLLSYRNIKYTGSQPFLFIVGSGRSGNTLLRKLLMEYSDIYIPPESYILGSEVITHLNSCSLSWHDKVDLTLAKFEYYPEFPTFEIDTLREFSVYAKKFKKEQQQIGTLIVELYKWIAEKKGYPSTWLGDKTPLNTLHLGLIKTLIPNAVYIYIERDGIDVCCSYVKAGIYTNIADAAHRWVNSRKAWNSFKNSIHQNSYIEIKYESMVDEHEKIIRNILDTFNIPSNRKISNVSEQMGDVSMLLHHANVCKRPNKNSIGKGRSSISDHDRAILQSIIGEELENASYKSP